MKVKGAGSQQIKLIYNVTFSTSFDFFNPKFKFWFKICEAKEKVFKFTYCVIDGWHPISEMTKKKISDILLYNNKEKIGFFFSETYTL